MQSRKKRVNRMIGFFRIFPQIHSMHIERAHHEIIIRLPDTINVEHVRG